MRGEIYIHKSSRQQQHQQRSETISHIYAQERQLDMERTSARYFVDSSDSLALRTYKASSVLASLALEIQSLGGTRVRTSSSLSAY